MNIFFLSLIPSALFVFSFLLHSVHGAYFLGINVDPEYAYLLNSLTMLDFETPRLYEHPGTTVQTLGALVILVRWLISCFSGWSPLQDSVLKDPEGYLRAINIFFNVLIAGALFLAGRQFFRYSKKLLPAIALQFSIVLFMEVQVALTRVSPEPVLVFAGLLLITSLIPELFSDSADSTGDCKKGHVLTGIALGFGIATKVTFLPLMALLLLFKGIRPKVTALLCCLAAFFIFTIPIIKKYPLLVHWLWNFMTHKGTYGRGEAVMPGIDTLILNLKRLYYVEQFLFISLGFYILVFIFLKFYRGTGNKPLADMKTQRLLLAGIIVIAAQIAVSMKQPAARYMLPAMVMTSLLNAALVFTFLEAEKDLIPRAALMVFFAVFIMAGAYFYRGRLDSWISRNRFYNLSMPVLSKEEKQAGNCLKVEYYGSPSLEAALAFGNELSNYKFIGKLNALYPRRTVFYNLWAKKFYTFDDGFKQTYSSDFLKTRISYFLKAGGCVVMSGGPFVGPFSEQQGDLILTPLMKKYPIGLYKLEGFK